MALPVTIPNTFANATASIPLSQLDTNFNTLANAVNGISDGSESLANVSVTGGTISNVAVSATTLNTSGAVVFNDAGADVDFRVGGDTDANLLFVDAGNDRVGIGTSSPSTTLEIAGSYGGSGGLVISQTQGNGNGGRGPSLDMRISKQDDNDPLVLVTGGRISVNKVNGLNTSGAADMVFFTSASDDTLTERMRIDSSGNVGIGTSSPSEELHVYRGSATGTYLRAENTVGILYAGVRDTGVAWVATESDDPLTFGTNGTERMRIDSIGNLLVGTTTAGAGVGFSTRLAVDGGNSADTAIFKWSGAAASAFPIRVWNTAASGDNLFVDFATETSYTGRGSIDYNRGAGLTRYNTTSDATLKNIIGDSDGEKSVEILNSTRIREFAWKEDETQKPQIGVIAQELYETFKGAVSVGGDVEKQRDITEEIEEEYVDEEGNTQTRTVTTVVGQETYTEYQPWGVDKTAFTFHLVAGWQAHEKIIKQQADMIAALEARIAALENA